MKKEESAPTKDSAIDQDKTSRQPPKANNTIGLRAILIGVILASLMYYLRHGTTSMHSNEYHIVPSCHKYAVMVDAGSTGSRIHVYKFHQCHHTDPARFEKEELFAQTIPGLSAYAQDPDQAALSLDPLLKDAEKAIPEQLHSRTPIALKATAGLRLLGDEKSENILRSVYHHLKSHYPFHIVGGQEGVSIMDGRDEGVYAWITVNFLLGNFDTPSKHTVAVLDLGGGSTQIVFEPDLLPDGTHVQLPHNDFKYQLQHEDQSYLLYQYSYLGYGLMEARKQIHQKMMEVNKDAEDIVHVCLPRDLNWVYKKGEYPIQFTGKGYYSDCLEIADMILKKDEACQYEPCAFNGIHQPNIANSFSKGPIYILSYFYDRTIPLGLPATFYLPELASLTESVCTGSYLENLTDVALREEILDRPEWCLDLSFIYRLLSYGYEIPDDREITTIKTIDGVETGWCLGAAIAVLGDNSLRDIT
ncbi:nucleoside phosphatase GDA1/CD39 [Pilobolus umbonatus]|nr:nucleoside phosphatase GDA1/CD39 [Pilobolus umbonatus]